MAEGILTADGQSVTGQAGLTVVPEKREAFATDLYFREGWADLVTLFGPKPAAMLHGLAVLTAKPDAVVGRRLPIILNYLISRGFTPVAVARFSYSRHSIREIWRYDWNVYPIDRLELSTFWYTSTDSILFLLRDTRPIAGIPATVRLSSLKGLGDPAKRTAEHLRTVLRPPNRILNFVHVTDEPADIVRELAIFLDRPARHRLLADAARDRPGDAAEAARAEIERLHADYPAHDLDLDRTLARMAGSRACLRDVARLKAMISAGQRITWDELCSLVPPADPGVDRWDFIVLATSVLHSERNAPALMPDVSIADWAMRVPLQHA